jgi:hypothetical protein
MRRRLITLLLVFPPHVQVLQARHFSYYQLSSSHSNLNTEQKRRQAIREGFDRLTELVPGLEGQGRSESVVLKKTVDYMRAQLAERRRLVGRIEEMGGVVEEGMRR